MRIYHRHPLAAALSAAVLALTTASAYAQQTSAPTSPQAQAQPQPVAEEEDRSETSPGEPTEFDAVIVTGSRIPRAGFDTLEPATVVDEEYIESRGLTNVADALSEIPGFAPGVTPEGPQATFGVGRNFVNFYGLGSQRTLTLIDGRRVVSANAPSPISGANPGLQVDLNMIPTQLVDRVEILTVGGAPTYGSDAIAGVVNLILKRDYEGAQVKTTYALTDRGDAERFNYSALVGQNFAADRGNFTVAVSFDQQEGLLRTERDFLSAGYVFSTNPLASNLPRLEPGRTPANDGRYNPDIPFDTGPNDGIPNSVLFRDFRISVYNPGGVLLPATGSTSNFLGGRLRGFGPDENVYLQFDPNGNIVPYDPGISFGGAASSGGDGYNGVEFGQITSDLERRNLTLLGRFDFGDRVSGFYQGMFYQADAFELIDSPIFNNTANVAPNNAITFTSAYPLLSAQARGVLAANGITSFRLGRASADLVTANARSETEISRHVLGLEGDFRLGGRDFSWEVSANFGRAEATTFRTELNQQNFVNAINVVVDPASGRVVCSPTAVDTVTYGPNTTREYLPIADPNCVPLNLFGEGAPSREATDYVTTRSSATAILEQRVYNANLTGVLFDTWAGPVDFNVGLERREEQGSFTPDEFQRQGLGRVIPIAGTRGEFSTNELFGEFVLPLASADDDLPFLKRLDITGKARRVDNTVNGLFTAYTYGLQWQSFRGFEIRGNKTRSLRAPAIVELFTPTSPLFVPVPDACDSRNIVAGENPAVRQANCAAFFNHYNITPPWTSGAISINPLGTTGGDPELNNEIADSSTIGFVWQPSFVPGLRLAVDYTEIEIEDVIANLSGPDIVTGCFDNPDFNASDVPQANEFCSRILRDGTGQVTGIRTGYVNGGFLNFTGVTAQAQYRLDLDDYGLFNFGLIYFTPRRLESSFNGVTTSVSDGEIGNSRHQLQWNVAWQRDRWGLSYSGNYQSSALYDTTFTVESRDILRADSYWLHNAGVSYQIGEGGLLRLAVTNLLDEEPPFPISFDAFGTYDVLGRRYALSFEWEF